MKIIFCLTIFITANRNSNSNSHFNPCNQATFLPLKQRLKISLKQIINFYTGSLLIKLFGLIVCIQGVLTQELAMENNPVQVFLRFRPSLQSKKQSENDLIDLQNSTNKMVVLDKTPYVFDQIFHSSSSQQHVFETMVRKQSIGYANGCSGCFLLFSGEAFGGERLEWIQQLTAGLRSKRRG